MRPKERRDSGQKDLFRARLDQIVDIDHPPAKLVRSVDWGFLEARFGAVYGEAEARPPAQLPHLSPLHPSDASKDTPSVRERECARVLVEVFEAALNRRDGAGR